MTGGGKPSSVPTAAGLSLAARLVHSRTGRDGAFPVDHFPPPYGGMNLVDSEVLESSR